MRLIEKKGETVGFALFETVFHWGFECAEGSIPFTRSTSPPFILNGLQLRFSCENSDFHYGFIEQPLQLVIKAIVF